MVVLPAMPCPMITRLLLIALVSLFVGSCSTPTPGGTETAEAGAEELPKVWPRCPEWEKLCGPAKGPDLWLTGKQAMIYIKPGKDHDSIRIIYEGKNKPREIRNMDGTYSSDGKIAILGQQVDFYGSGNEEPEISTQPTLLTSPDGWSGWFSFDFSSREHLQGKNIPAFAW